jgi:hypothetical protein
MPGVTRKGQTIDSQQDGSEKGEGTALRLPGAAEALERGFVIA